MAWIYLQGLGVYPTHSRITLDQLPTVKLTPTVKVYSCRECKKEICPKHQYGMTYERFPVAILLKLISSMEAFPARTSVVQELEKAWKESEADYFSRSCAWPKKSSPRSYSLKTFQLLQAEGDYKSLEKLPRWGMTVDGVLYPLLKLELSTDARDGSYWLTPSTMEHLPVRQGKALERSLYRGNSTSKRKVSGRLNEQVVYPQMWPTTKTKMIATPIASQAGKPIRKPSPSTIEGKHGENIQDSIGRLNPELIGKKLSVAFVESMMGYPIGWTGLKHLETQSCHSK